jgi:aryl-alcohol dehydrogenase-like predicted oxidoreductase
MQQLDFLSIGKTTSRIGLGCARLAAGSTLRQSARVVEAALELGIRYFDVAPSYGMGTAEDVLGAVVGSSDEVTICTKVGVPRPPYRHGTNLVRRVAMPLFNRAPSVKAVTKSLMRRGTPQGRPPFDYSSSALRACLDESLERLGRDSVDVFLAHEPAVSDLSEDVGDAFRALVDEGLITTFGAAVTARGDRWSRFGSVWQSGWPGPSVSQYRNDISYIFHGVLRPVGPGETGRHASKLLREAVEQSPGSILLVSASTPKRLQDLLKDLAV